MKRTVQVRNKEMKSHRQNSGEKLEAFLKEALTPEQRKIPAIESTV
jgi:hypothetical protein